MSGLNYYHNFKFFNRKEVSLSNRYYLDNDISYQGTDQSNEPLNHSINNASVLTTANKYRKSKSCGQHS
jgi:hypothetical protein